MSARPQSASVVPPIVPATNHNKIDPLRCTANNVAMSTAPLRPPSASSSDRAPSKPLQPRLVVRSKVKVPIVVDDMDTLSSGTDSFIVSPVNSPKAPGKPIDPNNGSLRTLLAARRVAKILGSSRRGGVSSAKADAFPNQPATSRFLANAAQNVSATPLQFVLDIGSDEEDPTATMEHCIRHLRAYLETCANSVERQSERVQAVLGQLQVSVARNGPDATQSEVAELVRRRVGSVSNASLLLPRQSPAALSPRGGRNELRDDQQRDNDHEPDQEPPAPELLYQVACELHALMPRRLPDFVLCYWDFTTSGSLEESLRSAFTPLGAALEHSRSLIAETNKFLLATTSSASPNVLFEESFVFGDSSANNCELQIHRSTRRNQTPAFKEIPAPPLCAVTWKLQYCRLRGVSFAELPLSFAPPPANGASSPSPILHASPMPPPPPPPAASSVVPGDHSILQTSFRIGGMTIVSPRAARPILSSLGSKFPRALAGLGSVVPPDAVPPAPFVGSYRLASLSISHCAWRESSKFGLQHVLHSSGWGIEDLELRGAQMTEELVQSVAGVIRLGPHAVLSRVTCANCKGWSTTDPTMQLLMMDALKASRCIKELILQGVPVPPTAGIALLAAVQSNPVVDNVRLESCHFVTPKFLATLHEKLHNPERRNQPSPIRGRRGSMSTIGEGTRRSSFASLLA
ncbi:Hypothetical protein, putative [Bodo saltans]|uniref:Uncharacterized protein n=1 Tax=Bodo saltans TaxID=75058 RepID=A0A0S4JFK4_BODSA|nr:Hypothetical protein, putative [Bodo saltans]|eukprot:CUG88900.1 Hypothetical protein, putative [Bodo saltans]